MSNIIWKWNMHKFVTMIVATILNKFDCFIVVEGNTGCLSGDTIIRYSRGHNARKRSIKKLYHFYEKIKKGKANIKFKSEIPTYIRAWNGKEIRLHRLKDVMYSGKKEVYEMELDDGKIIKATFDHKFLTNSYEWKQLIQLKIGDEILCDTPIAEAKKRKRIKLRDVTLSVKHHPYNKHNGIEVHRLIYEARMNNLEFCEYLDILLNEKEKTQHLKFINPDKYDIHHKDGCHYNNAIENLEILQRSSHRVCHGNDSYANFSQGIPKSIKIKSIEKKGIEDTYDIECDEPFHNFVANDIIVHNCGKSTFSWDVAFALSREFKKLYRLDEKTVEYYYERVAKKQGLSPQEFVDKIMALKQKKAYYFNPFRDLIYSQDAMQNALASWNRIFIPDEAINIVFNRDFFSQKQKDIIKELNMFRDHNNIILSSIPSFMTVDNQVRNLTKIRITIKKRGVGIIHLPNKTIYCKDKWDAQFNEKIERGWIMKKIQNPNYSKLTTFRGLLKFPPMSKAHEKVYQDIKNQKRASILKDELHIDLKEEKDAEDVLIERLLKGGVKNMQVIEGIALANRDDFDTVRNRIRKKLIERGENPIISSYFYDKKAQKQDNEASVSITA